MTDLEPDLPTQLPSGPDGSEEPLPPAPVPVPPEFDPKLMPYAQWRQDEDKGARAAHDDARRPPSGRLPPEDVAAEGYPYWSGYQHHLAALRDAGVIS